MWVYISLFERKKLSTKKREDNLLLYHTVKDRFYTQDLVDGMELPTVHDANEKLKVSRYSNGVSAHALAA